MVHVHVATQTAEAVSLYQGTLSSYYLGKLKQGEEPEALASRRIPLVSWRAAGELVAAPLQPLALGQYSLVSARGLLSELTVTHTLPLLTRLWPPAGSGGLQLAVYCASGETDTPLPSEPTLLLEPRQLSVALAPGVSAAGELRERCLHFSSDIALEAGELLVPPPALGEWALSPALFSAAPPLSVTPVTCRAGEQAAGPGCITVADDRAVVRTPVAPVLWVVHTGRGTLVQVTQSSSPLTIPGLSPGSREPLSGQAFDAAGAARTFDLVVSTAPARERPILSEALADALGPEPQSEWVELFNDGTLAVDLAQYSLQDSGGRTPLPHARLESKAYALLVREDFAPNASDEPPAAGAQLIRVPALGKSGLANAGERLALLDSAGAECSVLPALAGKPGQSLARRSPSSRDDDPSAFHLGTPTPGLANDSNP